MLLVRGKHGFLFANVLVVRYLRIVAGYCWLLRHLISGATPVARVAALYTLELYQQKCALYPNEKQLIDVVIANYHAIATHISGA